jgi:hypothetical protein
MIDLNVYTLFKDIKYDEILYCTYIPSSRGDITLNNGWWRKDKRWSSWHSRLKNDKSTTELQANLTPVYGAEFVDNRKILFPFGSIFLTENLKTKSDQDFRYLSKKMLYIQRVGDGRTFLISYGKRRKSE